MADLYNSALGANTRKVLTTSDVTGPETTWLIIDDVTFETGTDFDPELTTANSVNHQVVQAIAQWCEIYEVVRPDGQMAVKVRANSVPYADGEARNDEGINSILTAAVRAATGVSGADVYNGAFDDDNINWDD
jgi:hypothetical protein